MHCTSKVLKKQHCSTNKYTTTKYKLLSDLRNAGIEYFSNKLELNKSDISKWWNVLKDILCRNCKAKQRKVTFITDNGCISDSVMIANECNDFFVSIGDKLASKITSNISPLSFVNNIPNSMAMSEASPNEVLQIIQSLKKIQVWIG